MTSEKNLTFVSYTGSLSAVLALYLGNEVAFCLWCHPKPEPGKKFKYKKAIYIYIYSYQTGELIPIW